MRRGTRWLLLVAIAAILSGIGYTYKAQKKIIIAQALPAPTPLAGNLHSAALNWCYTETDAKNHNRVTAEICASDFKEVKDSSRVDLKDVTLKLPNKTEATYDLIKRLYLWFGFDESKIPYVDGRNEGSTINVSKLKSI